MLGRRSLVSVIALFALAYALSPFVTVWLLAQALQNGNAGMLERVVDWKSVRDGLKDDIADGIIGPPEVRTAGNTLPQFGASFVSGIAGSMVDQEVTPQHVLATVHQMEPAGGTTSTAAAEEPARLRWAFFDSPTSFTIRLRCPGQDMDDEPLRVRLQLRSTGWQVTRVWVPQDIVEQAASRT